jgi:transposase
LDAGAQKGTVRVPNHQTVETYLKWCLESMQPSLKPTTYTSYDETGCRDCEIITQAPLPLLPIERGLPGSGLLAHVLTSKYCDPFPLHRQSVIYAREGVELEC